ncbi:MAG: hypothetical protein HY815_18940 [Candidatus Riflebacteria bacterium]|nr:hypothetical protein [Candidatus Riflebacteria bacterium]
MNDSPNDPPEPRPEPGPGDGAAGAPPLWLVAIAVLANLAFLWTGMFKDDFQNIHNARAAELTLPSLGTHFFHDGPSISDGYRFPWLGDRPTSVYFRPVLVALFKGEDRLFGLWAPGYHAVNLGFHLLNALLVLGLGRRLLSTDRQARWAALLFLFHRPAMQSAGWVSGRTEVIATTCLLGMVLAYARFRDQGRGAGGWVWFLLALALVGLGQGVKETCVLAPLIAWAYDRGAHPRRRFSLWPVWFVAIVAAGLWYRSTLPGLAGLPPTGSFNLHGPAEPGFVRFLAGRLAHSLLTVLAADPGYLPYRRLIAPGMLICLVGLASALGWLLFRSRQALATADFLLAWLLLSLAPALPLMAQRFYLYPAAVPACLIFARLAGPPLTGRSHAWLFKARAVLLVLFCLNSLDGVVERLNAYARYSGDDARIVATIVERAIKVGGPLRIHLFGATVMELHLRQRLRLALPDRELSVHVVTLAPVLFGRPHATVYAWPTLPGPDGRGAVLRADLGPVHPVRSEPNLAYWSEDIRLDVGDSLVCDAYETVLGHDSSGYHWLVRFKEPIRQGSLFFAIQPRECEWIGPDATPGR